MLDDGVGAILLVAPSLLGVSDRAWVPHLMFGLLEIGAVLLSQIVPATTAGSSRGGTVEAPDADRR